jgi:hypothetical protein
MLRTSILPIVRSVADILYFCRIVVISGAKMSALTYKHRSGGLAFLVVLLIAGTSLLACTETGPGETPPGWLDKDSSILNLSTKELQQVALFTIPGGKTTVVPVRIKPGEKYMMSWKLVSGPSTIGYMVKDPAGTVEFGLGGLTAVSKGRYDAELRYFCFINDTKPEKEAKVAVGTLFYQALPPDGEIASLPMSGKIDLVPSPGMDRSNVLPQLISRYNATSVENYFFSPVFKLAEGQQVSVTLLSDVPMGIRLPPSFGEHKAGPVTDISQAMKYNKDRAEWSYNWGKVDVVKYNRLDGGRRIDLTLIARPDNTDVDTPGLYQLKAFNPDESKSHWLEYLVK